MNKKRGIEIQKIGKWRPWYLIIFFSSLKKCHVCLCSFSKKFEPIRGCIQTISVYEAKSNLFFQLTGPFRVTEMWWKGSLHTYRSSKNPRRIIWREKKNDKQNYRRYNPRISLKSNVFYIYWQISFWITDETNIRSKCSNRKPTLSLIFLRLLNLKRTRILKPIYQT